MATPKLLTALNSITKDEWISFRKYLLMYTRVESDNFSCFLQLQKNKNKLGTEGLGDTLKKEHFPQMSPKVFSNMLSRLFNWYEDWFAIETFKQHKYSRELMLIKGYNSRGLYKNADQTARKLKLSIEKADSVDINQQKALAQLYFFQYYSNNPIKRVKDSPLFGQVLESFINSTTEQALGYLLEIENYADIRNVEYPDAKKILSELIETSPHTKLSSILNLTLKALRDNNQQALMSLIDQLKSNTIDSSSDTYLILTAYLSTATSKLWQKKIIDDPRIIYEIHQLVFEAKESNQSQKLLPVNMFNVVNQLAVAVDYEQTKKFINAWIGKVHTKFPDSTRSYCDAINAFRHERYEDLPPLIIGLEFDDYIYKLISNSLLIIAYYKLEQEDLVMTLIDNYKKQLKRNKEKVSVRVIEGLHSLAEIIVLLSKSKYDSSIKIDLSAFNIIFFRSWVDNELKN